jgi:heme/copper-type cytochrome/quinol oxidase subunit 2
MSFTKMLAIGGVISGGLTGILVLFVLKNAKKNGDRKSEYSIPLNWFLIILISLIFIGAILFELF